MRNTKDEYGEFQGLMDQLCSTWNRPKDDSAVKAYWNSLSDVRLDEVSRNVKRILKTAGPKQPFPKPSELRDTPVKEGDPRSQAAFEEGVKRSVDFLEDLRREDPEKWAREVRLRRLDRILATEPPHTMVYAEALQMWHQMREIRT